MDVLIVQKASGPCEGNRAFGKVSIDFYRAQIKVDSVLDIAYHLALSQTNGPPHARTVYSTSCGALYPAFAMTWYLIALPFSFVMRNGSLFEGFTSCTLIRRNLPSCEILVG